MRNIHISFCKHMLCLCSILTLLLPFTSPQRPLVARLQHNNAINQDNPHGATKNQEDLHGGQDNPTVKDNPSLDNLQNVLGQSGSPRRKQRGHNLSHEDRYHSNKDSKRSHNVELNGNADGYTLPHHEDYPERPVDKEEHQHP